MSEKKIVLASNNAGKIREFNALFGERGICVVSQGSLGVTECAEPYGTFLENALAKARNAARQTGLPALADDSGITAAALGEPGVLSARYAGAGHDDAANNRKLVEALRSQSDKSAHYTCVLVAVLSEKDPEPVVMEARWDGRIVDEPKGTGGFGYDPHFFVPEYGCTAAELTAEQKNRLSHRGKAMQLMLAALAERWKW